MPEAIQKEYQIQNLKLKFYQTSKPGLFTKCDIKTSVKDNSFYLSRISDKRNLILSNFQLTGEVVEAWRGSHQLKLYTGDERYCL